MSSSHEHKHAPRTSARDGNEAIPTVSASGMPRIFPRHKDKRTSSEQDAYDEKEGSPPPELAGPDHDSDASDSENQDESQEEGEQSKPNYPPTGSLTLAAFNPYSSIPLSRRLALISGSVFINLGLPFLNGVMLGFGEIFARVVVAPALGITGVGWAGDTARAVANWSNWGRTPRSTTTAEKRWNDQLAQQRQPGDFDDWSATNDGLASGPRIEL